MRQNDTEQRQETVYYFYFKIKNDTLIAYHLPAAWADGYRKNVVCLFMENWQPYDAKNSKRF